MTISYFIKTRMAAQRQHVGSITSAEMRTKANKFLASKKKLNTLIEILETFEVSKTFAGFRDPKQLTYL